MSDDTKPVVSALIPTYRRPKLLDRAVRSVLAQTYPAVKACVYDNASGDETRPVMQQLAAQDPRVRYHCQPDNLGAGGNFNYAIAEVKTPFFSFLSDDDLLLPGAYEAAMAAFREHPQAGMVVLDVLILSSWGDLSLSPALQKYPDGLYAPPEGILAMVDPYPTTWTGIVYRSELLPSLKAMNLEVGSAADIDFTLRACALRPFAIRHVPGAIYTHDSIALSRLIRGTHAGFWPGWMTMVDGLCSGTSLPAEVSRKLRDRLMQILKKNIALSGLSGVVRGDFQEASEAAELLKKELHESFRGTSLGLLSGLCRRIPLFHRLVTGLFGARVKARSALRKADNTYRDYYPLITPSSTP